MRSSATRESTRNDGVCHVSSAATGDYAAAPSLLCRQAVVYVGAGAGARRPRRYGVKWRFVSAGGELKSKSKLILAHVALMMRRNRHRGLGGQASMGVGRAWPPARRSLARGWALIGILSRRAMTKVLKACDWPTYVYIIKNEEMAFLAAWQK